MSKMLLIITFKCHNLFIYQTILHCVAGNKSEDCHGFEYTVVNYNHNGTESD